MVDVKAVCQKVQHKAVARQNKRCKRIEFCRRLDKAFVAPKYKTAVNVEVHGGADNSCRNIGKRQVHKGYSVGKCYGKQNKNGIVHQKRCERRKREPEKPLKAFKVCFDKIFHSPADSPPFFLVVFPQFKLYPKLGKLSNFYRQVTLDIQLFVYYAIKNMQKNVDFNALVW